MLLDSGWVKGDSTGWDVNRALFPVSVVEFIKDTQSELWTQTSTYTGDRIETLILDELVKELDLKGTIHVLRHGLRFYGKTWQVAYFQPAHGLNPDTVARFARNELTVTRQVLCHPGKGHTVDLLFALNGVPVATCELKNPMTRQTWRDAVRQYQTDRNPDAPLFRFRKRTLVHFAADSEEIHMTTRLAGDKTRFLPFNRGSHPGAVRCGAGNPQHPSGYRTTYFWQEVLERETFLDILSSFVFVERQEEKVYKAGKARIRAQETVIFPRYHQLDAVKRLVGASRVEGPGHNYLIQHSAGSGKTNSISWLAHRLSSLHTTKDEKVFDGVIVLSDRNVLDQQLQDAVYQIEQTEGVVAGIDDDSKQLTAALIDKTMIIVTTLQKFPFVIDGLFSMAGAETPWESTKAELALVAELREKIAGRRYAVVVDEAHSSQTGHSAAKMKGVLGSRTQFKLGDSSDWEDGLNAAVEARGPQPNLSFFAFTATPKAKTLELFGRVGPSGKPEPYHMYSMRQAIEEGFILDVLSNFTDYDTYYKLLKTAEDDEDFPKRRTAVALAKFMTLHEYNITQKTEVIIEHFRNHVMWRMGGKAKGMVVAGSRLHAVRYMQAFERYIADRGYTDVYPLVAFSGTVTDPDTGLDYTEPQMNIDRVTGRTISEKALPSRFATPDYQILLVARKYQTGFDQPLLQAMYIDQPLSGVQAVQTLSRLNRVAPGKAPPFVLDFVNHPDDIRKAFVPYYDQTQLGGVSDPYQLNKLKYELDETRIYRQNEVDAFSKVYYLPPERRTPNDHSLITASLQPAVDRFNSLDQDLQTEFLDRLGAFVRLYGFLSQIIPYADSELEQFSGFGRKLLPNLRSDLEKEAIHLGGTVELEYYRLQEMTTTSIDLGDPDNGHIKPHTDVGTGHPEEDKAPFSEIIKRINERFGTNFTEKDALFLQQVEKDALENEDIRETALANPFDKFALSIREQLPQLMIERMAGNDAIVTRCLNDPLFQEVVFAGLLRRIFEAIIDDEE